MSWVSFIFVLYFPWSITVRGEEGLFCGTQNILNLNRFNHNSHMSYKVNDHGLIFFWQFCFNIFLQHQYENCVPSGETTVSDVCLCICSDLCIGIKRCPWSSSCFLMAFFFLCGPKSCKTESSSFLTAVSITHISVTCKLTPTSTLGILHFKNLGYA